MNLNLRKCDDFSQIRCLTRTGADALGSVHCQPTGWMRGRIAHPTSWLASSGPCVVKHSLVHKEQFVLHVDSAPRRGKADQPDAQQVRPARQPFRLRWTRSRFGRLPMYASPTCSHLPVPQAGHGPWMFDVRISKHSRKSCSARFSSAYRPEPTCENIGRLAMINAKYIASLAASQSSAYELRRPLLVMLVSPTHARTSSGICGPCFLER